ncbi:ATP-binding protein [Rhodococcus globerulus]|uniref:ATP-binding protein n=1 Tax=Rhodococcus globerulus TaxID=33008 RepID=A0ABU4C002_RHOGO|nr:ATP-binding protein [Rhodococcus globerulus]MDV6269832.1 ATP-binding protein [Rhodococcus globerulus]
MPDISEVSIVGTQALTADESLAGAVGLHHTITTALADLVDNSLDAGAAHVLIRFVQDGTRIVSMLLIDDGCGMDAVTMDAAMTYGRRRDYGAADLGHFGVGMKAASLSQARVLRVWSRRSGNSTQGREIDSGQGRQAVSVIDEGEAASFFDAVTPRFPFEAGTIVEWRGITTFLMSANADEQTSWLEQTINDVRSHLGVVFHRLIESGRVALTVDVFDVEAGRAGALRSVGAVDPFAYPRTGSPNYPRQLTVSINGSAPVAHAHIWPARSNAPEFRLHGAPGRDQQGLYFYRHDRLLQIGGWNGIVRGRPDYGLARVSIDLDDNVLQHITINPEKSGVTLDATATAAIDGGVFADGTANFRSYLDDAENSVRVARSHQPRPISVVEPTCGLPEDVLDSFSDAFEFTVGADPVAIGWRALARDQFFEVDLKTRTLWINARFRRDLLGRRSLDNTDAPVLKSLIYLLVGEMFEGVRISARQKEKMQAWQEVLISAMAAHREQVAQ